MSERERERVAKNNLEIKKINHHNVTPNDNKGTVQTTSS